MFAEDGRLFFGVVTAFYISLKGLLNSLGGGEIVFT